MTAQTKQSATATDIGQQLLEHAKQGGGGSKPGLVVELFPYIYGASATMSCRAISRFLLDKFGVQLSAVTIAAAVADPKKYWNQYFDVIEPFASVVAKGYRKTPIADLLFDDQLFAMTGGGGLPIAAFRGHWTDLKAMIKMSIDDAQAMNVLREKWYAIDLNIRLSARQFIADRLAAMSEKSKKGAAK